MKSKLASNRLEHRIMMMKIGQMDDQVSQMDLVIKKRAGICIAKKFKAYNKKRLTMKIQDLLAKEILSMMRKNTPRRK